MVIVGVSVLETGGHRVIIAVFTTRDDLLIAAGPSAEPGRWLGIFDELIIRIGSRFRRVEPRRRARAFALGLLAELPRVNCWTIAEHAGDSSLDGMQYLLARAKWDADGSATISAALSWSTSATRARCWSPARPGPEGLQPSRWPRQPIQPLTPLPTGFNRDRY